MNYPTANDRFTSPSEDRFSLESMKPWASPLELRMIIPLRDVPPSPLSNDAVSRIDLRKIGFHRKRAETLVVEVETTEPPITTDELIAATVERDREGDTELILLARQLVKPALLLADITIPQEIESVNIGDKTIRGVGRFAVYRHNPYTFQKRDIYNNLGDMLKTKKSTTES